MGEPRVWSPLQGYAPWALKRIAPLGLAPPSKAPGFGRPCRATHPGNTNRRTTPTVTRCPPTAAVPPDGGGAPPTFTTPLTFPLSTPPTKRSAHAARVGDSAQRGRSGDFLV